jgi:hypothetical protein
MTPEPIAARPMSDAARIRGVFVDPKPVFADVLQRPRWIIPAIILTICSLAIIYTYSQRVGWDKVVRESIEQSERTQNLPAEQKEQAIATGVKFAGILGWVQGAIGATLYICVVAAVLLFVAKALLGAKLRYAQMMGIVAYSSLVGVISTILTIVVMYMKSPEDFDIRNPLAFNIGAFLPESAPKWLSSLASSFDLFSFWTMALLAVGITVAVHKITFTKALMAVIIPWAIYLVIKVGWTAMFG